MTVETAKIVHDVREYLQLSHLQLTRALGMGPRGVTLVRKWEADKATPTASAVAALRFLARIERLEKALGMSMVNLDGRGRQVVRDALRTIELPDHLT